MHDTASPWSSFFLPHQRDQHYDNKGCKSSILWLPLTWEWLLEFNALGTALCVCVCCIICEYGCGSVCANNTANAQPLHVAWCVEAQKLPSPQKQSEFLLRNIPLLNLALCAYSIIALTLPCLHIHTADWIWAPTLVYTACARGRHLFTMSVFLPWV